MPVIVSKRALTSIYRLAQVSTCSIDPSGVLVGPNFNQALKYARRVADFVELGERMCRDSLHREESRGGHYREVDQTPGGEARRDDEHLACVAAGEYNRATPPTMRKEPLEFETVKPPTHGIRVGAPQCSAP